MKRAERATTSCVIHSPTGLGRYTKILPALRKEETMTHQLVSIGWMLLTLVLSASIGLERQIRGKSAGIRTQAIVGLTACLMMLISKYGFSDILIDGITRYDPSRVASQIVSGIGFLGAGIILTRHGAIRGLTTAATIWETAAIGMACGAGLWWLALAGTALHFIVIALLTPLVQFILMRTHGHKVTLSVHYTPGHGVLSTLLTQVSALGWSVSGVSTRTDSAHHTSTARFTASTRQDLSRSMLVTTLADLDGVAGVDITKRTTSSPLHDTTGRGPRLLRGPRPVWLHSERHA